MSEILNGYLGKPFMRGGRGPDAYDCYGLVMAVYRDLFNIALPDFDSPDGMGRIHEVMVEGQLLFQPIPFPEYGSIAAFAMHPRYVTHVGVVLNNERFIHILKQSSVTIERLHAPEWRGRVRGFYRWPR